MLVMKVVDKEFLFLSIYPLLFWNRSPQKKFNTSFFFPSLSATTPPPPPPPLSIRI